MSRPLTVPPLRRPLARALVCCALGGASLALARAAWRPLPAMFARGGLRVDRDSVIWLDPPGLSARRALFLARVGDEPRDVYVATARTGADDRLVSVRDVSNLTRSRDADETALVVHGVFAAFASVVDQHVVAFTVLDTRGDPTVASGDRGARRRGAVTRWQQTGRVDGYGVDRFTLVRPTERGELAFRDETLEWTADGHRVRVDPAGPRVLEGGEFVTERLHRDAAAPAWVTWVVDTVRAVPWIGPQPIAWAERLAFRAENAVAHARQATVGAHTQSDVAYDLADVLSAHATDTALEGRVADWPPAAIHGTVRPALAHEGEWTSMGGDGDPFVRGNPGAPPPMVISFVRTDAEREDSRVYVAMWDARQVELHVAPGSEEPMGATGETGTGAIPRDEATLTRVVAGFNGAFQALHGEFGVYGEGILLLPPKPYAATVALLADGSTGFGTWPGARTDIPDEVVEFRQNLTPLIDNGVFNPWHRNFWGGTVGVAPGGDLHTTRTAICMTREGYVGYFWGDHTTPTALADALLAARCQYAVHLDMNGSNTGFELYRIAPAADLPPLQHPLVASDEAEGTISGVPGLTYRTRRLVRRMTETMGRYIHRDTRDFFYLLLRPVLPGAPIAPAVSPAQPGEGTWHVGGMGATTFPWPMARTRIRPDPAQPTHWVNLVRIDPRRVALAPLDTAAPIVARVMGGSLATAGQLRIAMTSGDAGSQWSLGADGDGVAGEPLRPGMSVTRGVGIDTNGFLVMAVADAAVPDLVSHALERAGCGPLRMALPDAVIALADGTGAAGDTVPPHATPTIALIERAFVGARRIFPEVTPVSTNVWWDAQHRQVRYVFNHDREGTMQVRLSGQQHPVVLPIPGYPWAAIRAARDAGTAGTP